MKGRRSARRSRQKRSRATNPVLAKEPLLPELQETLEALTADGEVDSEGYFTISSEKADEKLGSFQLPTPQSWILVLVQAANRGGASKVTIRQSRTQTSVDIAGLPEWTWDELVPYFAQLHDDGSFRTSLAVAARALAGLPDGHPFEILTPHGTRVHRREQEWVDEPVPILGRRFGSSTLFRFEHLTQETHQLGFWARRKAAQRVQTELFAALTAGAHASPVLVVVDGRKLNDVVAHGEILGPALVVGNKVWNERRLLALLPAASQEYPELSFPFPKQKSWDFRRTHEVPEALVALPPALRSAAALGLLWLCCEVEATTQDKGSARRQNPGSQRWRLHWIKDGVLVGTEELAYKGALALTLYICGDGLPTDLSGLRLRQCPERTERRTVLKRRIHEELRELVTQSKKGVKVAALWSPWYTAVASGCVLLGGVATGGGAVALLAMVFSGGALTLTSQIHHLHTPNEHLATVINREWRQLSQRSGTSLLT